MTNCLFQLKEKGRKEEEAFYLYCLTLHSLSKQNKKILHMGPLFIKRNNTVEL
ncbi:hypothetical protein LguiB_006349 [Lonicera macranthoides]